ncbi:MAG: hypothetical protein L0H59_02025 [Tomitella sp.]|nr:hypothetical protein [Tomitella sp.]
MVRVLSEAERQIVDSGPVVSPWMMARSRREYSAVRDVPVRRGTSSTGAPSGWRRKPADEDLLRFLTLHGVLSLRQAARWFYRGAHRTARYRAGVLEQAGLLRRHEVPGWAGVVLVPTLDGQTVGLASAEFPVSHAPLRGHMTVPNQLLHRLVVAELALGSRASGRRVISERQIRMLDARSEAETTRFLQHEGVVFSPDGQAPGVRPAELTITVEEQGRTILDGTRNTWVALPIRNAFDERTAPFTDQRSGLRYPDFLEVSEAGELVSVEVEISTKSEDRVRRLVEGYARSLPVVRTGGRPDGSQGRWLQRRQFRQVRWYTSPDVEYMLCGHTDLISGVHASGLVQQVMPAVFGADYDWRNQDKKLSVVVSQAASVEPGIQYALDQRSMEPQYQCDYRSWKIWQGQWRKDVPEQHRAVLTFPRWLRVDDNLAVCRRATTW